MNTKFLVQVTMAAALAVAGSVAAFAQSAHLKAEITFPFKAFTADMAAGHYDVVQENNSGTPRFYLRNADTRKQIVLIAHAWRAAKSEKPSMTFRCVSAGCGLTEISSIDGQVYRTVSPKLTSGEKERLVTVYFDRVAGE